MITFIRLRIKGFCSYEGDNTLDLNQGTSVVIRASNGAGKSSIFSALVWCLYGKSIKGTSDVNTKKKYQTKDYQGTLVEVYFQRDNSFYKVIRCQNYTGTLEDGAKGKDRLIIIKDAVVQDIKGKVKLQEFLNNELGLTYNLFMNSIMFGQGMKKLIQESNTDKKKLFEEVFNLNYLKVATTLAKQYKNNVASKVSELSSKLRSLENEYNTAKEAYKDFRSREKNFKSELKEEKKNLLKDKRTLEKDIENTRITYNKKKVSTLEKKLNTLNETYLSLNNDISKAKTISNQPLIEVITHVVDLLEANKVSKALNLVKEIKRAYLSIEDLNDKRDSVRENISDIKEKLRKFKTIESDIEDLEESLEELNNKLSKLKGQKLEVLSPKYKKKAHKLHIDIGNIKSNLDKYQLELDNYNWLISDPLSNKGIKAYLFDSSLNKLNMTLEAYSKVLGFRIAFEVDLDSTKKDFVTTIEMDGEYYDYDELSGGQQQLCNVAMALAMNETLTSSKDINIAFLDEVFESLSVDNIDIVISLLDSVFEGKNLFLITHQDSLPLSNFKTLQVERINGISRFRIL